MFKEKPGDDTGMQTRVWGPAGWLFLHSIAQNYPWKPTAEQQEYYFSFFKLVGNVLPCRYCRESYQKYIEQGTSKLTLNTMRNRKSVVTWLYNIHNKINKKLGIKDKPTLREVWNKYESFRSKCHKSPEKVNKIKKGCLDPMKGLRKRCFIKVEDVDEQGNQFGKKTHKPYSKPPPGPPPSGPPPSDQQEITNAMNVLGVTDKNNVLEIKKKYRQLSLSYHPDRPTGDEEKFKEIGNAYEILMQLNGTRFGTKKTKRTKESPALAYYKKMFYWEDLRMLGINWKDKDNMDIINSKYKEANDKSLESEYKNIQEYHNKNSLYFENKYRDSINQKKSKKKKSGKVVIKFLSFGKGITKSGKKTIKLISIKKSNKSGKKLMATFETNGRTKIIHFGASGASDLTKHGDITRRNRYIFRHHKDLGTGNPIRAGYLSMFILWNKSSLQASIADYRRRLAIYNSTGKFPTNISGYKSPGKKGKYQ
jgi:curved DNA-binding protein CbpA